VFSTHPLSKSENQGKITAYVICLQNTFFFFEKYEVDPILFTNPSAHTSNMKIMFPSENPNPPWEGEKAGVLQKMAELPMGILPASRAFLF